LKWNFPFELSYWKSNERDFERKLSDESLSSLSDENDLIVEIKSLIKCYPETNRFVVNNISFNLYSNEITALVGHNGAGLIYLRNK
jgi:ABC-type polysaccharide/polyol phosphate transport system ATPase subunit